MLSPGNNVRQSQALGLPEGERPYGFVEGSHQGRGAFLEVLAYSPETSSTTEANWYTFEFIPGEECSHPNVVEYRPF
jgi:hypothetical protein